MVFYQTVLCEQNLPLPVPTWFLVFFQLLQLQRLRPAQLFDFFRLRLNCISLKIHNKVFSTDFQQ